MNDLELLLRESPEEARERERDEARRLRATSAPPLVLRGAGSLGRSVVHRLHQAGIAVAALADENPSRHGEQVDGVVIMPMREAIARYGVDARIAITICSPGASAGAVLRELRSQGCRSVTSFLPVLWAIDEGLPHYGFDRPSRVLEDRNRFLAALDLLADDLSKTLFVHQVRMRLTGEMGLFDHLVSPTDQYFPRGLVSLRPDEQVLDGGAYDGDTLRTILAAGSVGHVVCVEPDRANFSRLAACVGHLPEAVRRRVSLVEAALASRAGSLRFDGTGGTGAAPSEAGTVVVPCVTISDAMAGRTPTYVKLDIEGGEEDALLGAAAIIGSRRPRLAVCVYHKPRDLWSIPLMIDRMRTGYRFYLRCHAHDGFETVLYALPPEV
jgi:FkbM family methyltransferase